ncbi:hypothetical protein ACHAXR_002502 [Thalassiosira sp. AJA248-18]
MLIVSWNVAGLKPALQRIHSDYGGGASGSGATTSSSSGGDGGNNAKTKSSPADSHPFANYLRLHGDIDILCLQEHKIPLTQLSSRSEPHLCSSIPGYESFWSCATDQKARGFNGVCTYAKIGLVQSADSAPLKDPELDNQGRCVMTDHGSFVCFNVYVPHSRDFETLTKKMKFLNSLHNAMGRQREKGKRVILVGDLNLKIDKKDLYWKTRVLNVDEILDQIKQQNDGKDGKESNTPAWKSDIAKHWNEIDRVLQSIEAMPRQTTNPSTKKTFDRYCVRAKIAENNYAMLGSYEDTAEDALGCYTFDEQSYIDPDSGAATVCRKKNMLCIDTLTELMAKIGKVPWSENTQRQISESIEAGLNPDSPAYLWMKARLEEDGMVDVFRRFYPTAEARFTCWHQLKNKRYTNEGGRIDFTLVDKALFDHVEQPRDGQTLRCGKDPHSNPLGEEAALLAATAGGLFESGSYSGGGIAAATKRALDTQFGEAHSGMIYTPPSYSDHIAVSLLMKSSFKNIVGQLTLGSEASTRKAQPHKKQRSISSFFGSKSASSVSSRSTSSGGKRTILQDTQGSKKASKGNGSSGSTNSSSSKKSSVPKNSVLKHFGKK